MKNLLIIFFIAVLIVSSIQISAQTWSTNGIKMYINPTTTYVGIGTNNPESELEIYRGNIAIGGAVAFPLIRQLQNRHFSFC